MCVVPRNSRTGEMLRDVQPEDLLKFGLIPEFVGRLPVLATLDDLDEAAPLLEILTTPKNALVKQYQRLFEMEDVKLAFNDDALKVIARRAIERKTGARGLRSIMEGILLEPMYELPGETGISEVVINKEAAEKRAEPLYIYADRKKDANSAFFVKTMSSNSASPTARAGKLPSRGPSKRSNPASACSIRNATISAW